MALSRNKELRMFEALEHLTNHESFDSTASYVRRFVNCDLDLNNTHQSIPEEDIGDIYSESESSGMSENYIIEINSESEEDEISEQKGDGSNVNVKANENVQDSGINYSAGSGKIDGDVADHDDTSDDEMSEVIEAIKRKHGTEYVLMAEIKRSLELQESILEREREMFQDLKNSEEQKLQVEKKKVETQKRNLQSLITDYHKIKTSKDENDSKIKELTEKLRETKVDMNKRISRWSDQQKKLEERVKALENENDTLKKCKPVPPRIAALKRPPMLTKQAIAPKPIRKPPKRIQFADEVNANRQLHNSPDTMTSPETNSLSQVAPNSLVEFDERNANADEPRVDDDSRDRQANSTVRVVHLSDIDSDKTMPSDYVEMRHECGTITRVTTDKKLTRNILVNKDIMDEFEDCSVRYYYKELGFSQITYPNGDEVIEYDSGVLETIKRDGSKIYTYADGLVKIVDTLGMEEVYFVDGSVMRKEPNGKCIITWPSGQKEVRTESFVKRIYTNGTVKIMYADGSEETRYWNGRVRRKDKNGVLVDDNRPKGKSRQKKSNATI